MEQTELLVRNHLPLLFKHTYLVTCFFTYINYWIMGGHHDFLETQWTAVLDLIPSSHDISLPERLKYGISAINTAKMQLLLGLVEGSERIQVLAQDPGVQGGRNDGSEVWA